MSAHISGFSPTVAAARTGSPTSLLRQAVEAVIGWPQRRAVRAELAALSDRELADVGLSRGDLPHVFDAGFARARVMGRSA